MPDLAADRVAPMWLHVLAELAGRAAHEIRGALNGVAVNVEVVRSRTSRAGADLTAIAPFAAAAAEQLGALTERVEAVLVLARPPREPLDIAATLRHLVALLAPGVRAEGGALELAPDGMPDVAPTGAGGETARLVLSAVCLAAAAPGQRVTCRVARERAIIVGLRCDAPITISGDVAAIAADAGIELERTSTGIILAFPAA